MPETPAEHDAPASGTSGRPRWRTWLFRGAIASLALFGLIQLIPFGHAGNPPVTRAARWQSVEARSLAESACYDCHSNLTKRWWATRVAPASWLAQNDVNGGRAHLNFSAWDTGQADLEEVVRAVQSGSMPPLQYKLLHSSARLEQSERRRLVEGLEGLYAADPPPDTGRHGDRRRSAPSPATARSTRPARP